MMSLLAWKQKIWLQLAVIYTRYVIGGAFVFASLIKIKGERFTMVKGEGSPFHSPEHFFETLYQSGLYWQFLGVAQLVAWVLLLTQRYALLGALLFLPIIANIYVITISYEFGYTHVITGAMLLATVGLLAWDWNRLRIVLNQPVVLLPSPAFYEHKLWEGLGLVLFVYTVGYRGLVERYNPLIWFGVCVLVGALGLLISWVLYRRLKSTT
ncbi:hypothetical protein DNI29_21615 [Hymenobacter sediminis]|uniref:hypothetical protein n=1 Tax=Hymenobacter sediminis TaxID=2218621 RepID=UPI000DA64209|nr:hypothetical protein [Hymenobacter sediminis]RPD44310.1 hypothetical protein DNI29_21615 [Hymenobacter sediminis]